MFGQVIGLVGLPRSGTTMLTSTLAVHSRIEAIYEPFNRGDGDQRAPPDPDFAEFVAQFASDRPGKDVLLVKETTTHLTYLDHMASLLRSTPPSVATDLIFLWRDPFHAFMSEIEARRKWWGDTDVVASAAEFDRWADPRIGGLIRMIALGQEFSALLVFYEALVSDKERIVPALMDALGLPFEPRQLEYEKHLDRERVRGDVAVATNPAPISDLSMRQREEQVPGLHQMVAAAAGYARVTRASQAVSGIADLGIVRFNDPALEADFAPLLALS